MNTITDWGTDEHDDVIKWKHFPRNWPFVRGIHCDAPVTQSFVVFFDLRPNKRLSNNDEAGDLRRYRAHYDVIVMEVFNGTVFGTVIMHSFIIYGI